MSKCFPFSFSTIAIISVLTMSIFATKGYSHDFYHQSVHIFGGSGTDPVQNDLMNNLYQWITARNNKVSARYYTGIGVTTPDNHELIYNRALANICNEIANGVDDIYLFGFSRGAILAADLANIESKCGNEIAYRKSYQDNFNPQTVVKFVGLVDPVNTSIGQYSTTLPKHLESAGRSLVVRKGHHQGATLHSNDSFLSGDTTGSQDFYFDTSGRIRVFGAMCLTAKDAKVVKIDTCNSSSEQQFTKEFVDDKSGIFRVRSIYKKDKYIHLHYFGTSKWYEFDPKKTDGSMEDQLFLGDSSVIGRVRQAKKNDTECWTVQDWSRKAGKDLHKSVCVPDDHDWGVPGILSTTEIKQVAQVETVPGLWHQDLQCTLDVTDDGLSYPTNASRVEALLIEGAKAQGLNFVEKRERKRCDDTKKQEGVKLLQRILP